MLRAHTLDTPAGPLSLLAHGDAVVAGGFTADPGELRARLGPARRTLALRRVTDLGEVTRVVEAYLGGDLGAWDALLVDQDGTPGQHRVWAALRAVPAGKTITYTELARRAGTPAAVRAAGTACGRNLIAPIVPCHRALRSDGSLGGYHYGLPVKRWLLDHEAVGMRSTSSEDLGSVSRSRTASSTRPWMDGSPSRVSSPRSSSTPAIVQPDR